MSESKALSAVAKTRTGMILPVQAAPAIPLPLFVLAAAIPATIVP
jgi:hypothetical protein